MMFDYVMVNGSVIPINQIERIDFSNLGSGSVIVHANGEAYEATDFDALKLAVEFYKDMEGRPLRWVKHSWAIHNLIAHPVMQLLVWCGFTKLGLRVHDMTVPKPISLRPKQREHRK